MHDSCDLVAATPAHSRLAMSQSQMLEIWSIPTATKLHSVELGCAVARLVWSADGRRLLVLLGDGGLRIFDGESLMLLASQTTDLEGGGHACWSSNGEVVAAYSPLGNVVFWDWQRDHLESRKTSAFCLVTGALTPDGQTFAYPGNEDQICLIETFSKTELRQLGVASSHINALRFTADGSALLVGGIEGGLECWSIAESSLLWAVDADAPVSNEAS